MTPAPKATALIAEDEPLLAQALRTELSRAWPELSILETATNGLQAQQLALSLKPDVLFFDVRMPGQSGIDAAAALLDEWPDGQKFPLLVFVTAYDQYAVQAFETQAIDYLLKPVEPARLARTLERVQSALQARQQSVSDRIEDTLEQMRRLLQARPGPASGADLPAPAPTAALQFVQAGVGNTIRLIPVDEIQYFEAADKYVRVISPGHEDLIRTPLKDLIPQLDSRRFWQIHRGVVVHIASIDKVLRDDTGRLVLQLRGDAGRLAVSRLYAHLFKAM